MINVEKVAAVRKYLSLEFPVLKSGIITTLDGWPSVSRSDPGKPAPRLLFLKKS